MNKLSCKSDYYVSKQKHIEEINQNNLNKLTKICVKTEESFDATFTTMIKHFKKHEPTGE